MIEPAGSRPGLRGARTIWEHPKYRRAHGMSLVTSSTQRSAATGPGVPRFSRAELARLPERVLNEGHLAKARLSVVEFGGEEWVVKDFGTRSWPIRQLIGAPLIAREVWALRRGVGIEGLPADVFRLDRFAFAYRFVRGETLRKVPAGRCGAAYFEKLEKLVGALHARELTHLDVRNARNVLVDGRGDPCLIDFQSAISTRHLPGWVRRVLEGVDRAGVYKHWARLAPSTLDEARLSSVRGVNRWHSLWFFRRFTSMSRHD